MAVARTHHTKDYTCMSNYHFKDKSLSLKAKGLLSLMLSLPDKWDYSVAGLATLSSDGETSVRTAIKELEEHNYLKRTPVREDGRIVDWEYDIYEKPLEILEVEIQQVETLSLEINDNKVNKQSNTKKVNKVLSKDNTTEFPFGKQTKLANKPNLFTKCVSLIDSYDFSCWGNIRKLLVDYLQFRMSIKEKPLYTNMWKGMLNKLVELCDDDISMYESVIKQSIERGYLSFYPVNNNFGIKSESGSRHVPTMTKEDYLEEEKRLAELEAKGVQVRF